MPTPSHEWSAEERAEIRWLAGLPAIGAAALTVALLPTAPSAWPFAFLVALVAAYTTSFVGVMPLLLWFGRRGWRHPVHDAIAGCLGVLVPWLLVGVGLDVTPGAKLGASPSGVLMLGAFIGGALASVFGAVRRRKARR